MFIINLENKNKKQKNGHKTSKLMKINAELFYNLNWIKIKTNNNFFLSFHPIDF